MPTDDLGVGHVHLRGLSEFVVNFPLNILAFPDVQMDNQSKDHIEHITLGLGEIL